MGNCYDPSLQQQSTSAKHSAFTIPFSLVPPSPRRGGVSQKVSGSRFFSESKILPTFPIICQHSVYKYYKNIVTTDPKI